jgi:hypothetical protein
MEARYIGEIETMCGRDYKDEERNWLKGRLHQGCFPQKAFVQALKDFEAEDTFYLPAPKKALSLVERANTSLKPKTSPIEERPLSSDIQFKMAKAIREMIFDKDRRFSRQQIIDKMREAEGVKPGTGWMEETQRLHKHFEKCGDMSDPPANFISFDVR